MTRTALTVAALSFLTLFLHSCKNDSPVSVSPTRSDLLTGTTWKLQKALALGTNADMTSEFPVKSMTFHEDGTFDYGWAIGTWSFAAGESKIVLVDPTSGMQADCDIFELSSSIFRMSFSVLGASSATFGPSPPPVKSPEANFDTLWSNFDLRYSFFIVRNIDWNAQRTIFRPQVSSQMNDLQLFGVLSSMLAVLKDGHVRLVSSVGSYAYSGWYTNYPANYLGPSAITPYLSRDYGTTAGGMMRFGRIADTLGYLYVGPTFSGVGTVWSSSIDATLDSLKDVRGMVVDARNNGGGNESLAGIVASRFADLQRVYAYVRYRNGPAHTDFTDFSAKTIAPAGLRQFAGPTTLLTNRHCFSSAEAFVLMMRIQPNVTVVGDTTGGGSANPIVLELPNGWQYWVSRWVEYMPDQTIFEGIGLPPDVVVGITPADSAAGRDKILEQAIQILAK